MRRASNPASLEAYLSGERRLAAGQLTGAERMAQTLALATRTAQGLDLIAWEREFGAPCRGRRPRCGGCRTGGFIEITKLAPDPAGHGGAGRRGAGTDGGLNMNGWMGRLAMLLCLCLLARGDKDKMLDGSVRTSWSCTHRGAYVGLKLPDGAAGWLRVEWFFDPTDFELTEYEADKNVLRTRDQTSTLPSIYMLFDLEPNTKYVKLQLNRTDQKICNLRVYSAGALPRDVQQWQPPW